MENKPPKVQPDNTGSVSDCTATDKAGKPRSWKLWLVWMSRILLGATFIFSGFVKAVDPWGTIYKTQEYMSAFGLEQWDAVCLPVTFLLFTVEFMTGVYLIAGCYRRLATWTAMLFMALMLPLTLWIALKNPVPDCGCFGDALKLSNWATFWKNVVLTALTVLLLLYNRSVRCLITPALQWISFCITAAFILAVGWIGYMYQPLVDFRPYPVDSMFGGNSGDTGEGGDLLGVWERDGERITIPLDSIPEDESWSFVDRVDATDIEGQPAKSGSEAAVFDIDGEDVTADVLNSKTDRIILFYSSLKEISTATYFRTNSLHKYCNSHGIDLIAIATATPEQIDDFRDMSLSEFPIFVAEDTWIKEVVRGNPGVIFMRNGKIMWKSSLAAMTPYDFMESSAPDDLMAFKRNDSNILGMLILIYISSLLVLCILSLIPSVMRRITSRRHNRFIKNIGVTTAILTAIAVSSCGKDNDVPEPPDKNDRPESVTLIYMVGNNSLSSNIWADLSEMYSGCSSISLDDNRIVVYLAQPNSVPDYGNNIIGLFEIKRSENGTCHLNMLRQYSPETNSVAPEQIAQVMNDVREALPADSYGLFLWSHATGWLPSVKSLEGMSKVFGDDYGRSIEIENLSAALPDGMFEYIYFDCCLMGGIESCFALKDKARYIVSSPTEIMAEGAPYQLVLPYVARKNPMLTEAADAEYKYYLTEARNPLGFTISIVDCAALTAVAHEARNIVSPQYPYIASDELQHYGSHKVLLPDASRKAVTFYDFGQVFEQYALSRGIDCTSFHEALEHAVIYKASTSLFANINIDPNHFSGLSVHLPLSPDAPDYNSQIADFYNTLSWTSAILGKQN